MWRNKGAIWDARVACRWEETPIRPLDGPIEAPAACKAKVYQRSQPLLFSSQVPVVFRSSSFKVIESLKNVALYF